MKKLNNRGFTDKCYVLYTTIWILVLIFSCICTVLTSKHEMDVSVLNTLVEKSTEVMMVFTGFIVWKAKTENCKKFNKEVEEDEE